MVFEDVDRLKRGLKEIPSARMIGRVRAINGSVIRIAGLENTASVGDRLRLLRKTGPDLLGDTLFIDESGIGMLPDTPPDRVALNDRVLCEGAPTIAPCWSWIGRVVDPFGAALDGAFLPQGSEVLQTQHMPPAPCTRKPFGPRLNTGFHVLNTILPIVRGQRIGLFAGSGVGKTLLLSDLVKHVEADLVVLALVGERGREIGDFRNDSLGPAGMARTVLVAASAESPPTTRFRCAATAIRIAEFFRDQGKHVLLIVDSLTRVADAHREVAVTSGEFPGLRGFPASTPAVLSRLIERAGTGAAGQGDITAIYSVLVAGSDMEEPIADMLRGVLDGHVVLDRAIAERGLFPAFDVLKSTSRSLPKAARREENQMILAARRNLATLSDAAALIEAGLYTRGSQPRLDEAIEFNKSFSGFAHGHAATSVEDSLTELQRILQKAIDTSKTSLTAGH